MKLEVIGAGFGRTGTESLKLALEMLGLGRCHHMKEVLPDERLTRLWGEVADGKAPDWDDIFAGFGCTVDWPSARFWREHAAHFPEAKVILTLRSPESWYASFSKTIALYLAILEQQGATHHQGYRHVAEGVFGGRYGDRDHAIATYERNTRDVIEAIPPARLLVLEPGEGWEPLCAFLGRPVPAAPYPRVNSTADFEQLLADLRSESA